MIVRDEIHRDEATHTYWKKDNSRVVGITELLTAHGYLGGYFSDEALRRGTNVHLALHFWAKRTLDEKSIKPHLRPYFDSAMEFLTFHNAKILLSESMVFDEPFGVACTLDIVLKIFGCTGVLDYKTGKVLNYVRYQTACAVNGLPPLPNQQPYRRFGLQLRADGNLPQLKEFSDPTDLIKVRQFASVFYTRVNDGVVKWPQTKQDFETQRRKEYGIDNIIGAADETIRNGEGALSPAASG